MSSFNFFVFPLAGCFLEKNGISKKFNEFVFEVVHAKFEDNIEKKMCVCVCVLFSNENKFIIKKNFKCVEVYNNLLLLYAEDFRLSPLTVC